MAFGSMFNKAKDMASKAGDTTKDMASKAGDTTKDMASKAGDATKDMASKAGDMAKDAAAKVGDISNMLKGIINDVNASLPILAKYGYIIDELEVEVGLIPKIIPHFTIPSKELTEEEKEEMLSQIEGNKIASLVVSSLLQADKLQKMIKVGNLKFAEVGIEASIPPTVTLKFN